MSHLPQIQIPEHAQEPSQPNLSTWLDTQHRVMWYYMHAQPRPCFSPDLLSELSSFRDDMAHRLDAPEDAGIDYMVLASKVPGIFNLGGDLALFRSLVEAGDRQSLQRYAHACIDMLWTNISGIDGRDITTISLVQGEALGGGFEGAMSAHVLIAERSARMGLPEILFNLFPGMGAYSLLSRKLDPVRAERLILSGRIHTAEELHAMGVVDVLAEDGQGEQAVYDYIARENRARNGFRALRAAKRLSNPVTREELIGITEIWVDAALRLTPRDLRMMERLVARQSARGRDAA
ncbi:enoyl-CoA hydratase [Thioalkalivibrio sulfidiphilus HL-EbGr7]|uniref:Enoyl-CoA hydratase n=1 Tax=Thioalkalivibrio sulfidiphilus (strain HL-EbGR7) TaxID=396588 RepID=B8GTC7_THISH|nr:crotonase/enoyl-CoA hydratase family protein [Thioalkalivibrio sulfidiphilus]ACL71187.1 enoyl-CoA hydratase [Thioalkalivibrio sulfidiphilus HL-EbGr7]